MGSDRAAHAKATHQRAAARVAPARGPERHLLCAARRGRLAAPSQRSAAANDGVSVVLRVARQRPGGYRFQRQLTAAGHGCVVVAPSLIPRKPGDRIKTDRQDATNLAKLHRAGELTPVWVPDPAHEAIRVLLRARLAAVRGLRQARQQLSGFLLRHGHHYNRPAWTLIHRRWLAGLKFEQAVHHIVLEDCIAAVEAATARRDRLEA